jgi:hypothetical protein
MENLQDRTPVCESAYGYEAPAVVDLGTLNDLTNGASTEIPDTAGIGESPPLPIPISVG